MDLTQNSPVAPALETIIELPFDLYLREDCLGDTYEIRVGPIVASLALPRLVEHEGRYGKMLAAPQSVSRPRHGDWEGALRHLEPWGRVHRPNRLEASFREYSGSQLTQPDPVLVRHVALIVSLAYDEASSIEERAEAIANRIASNIDEILANLRDWTEVAAFDSLPGGVREMAMLPLESFRSWSFDGIRRLSVQHKISSMVAHSESGAGLDRATWLRILQLVGRNVHPPIEHIFLKDALASLNRRDTRKAVLDSATAAELALSKMLNDRIDGLPPPATAIILNATQGISRLAITLQSRFGVHLPPALNQKLGRPRNRTIHAGEIPSFHAAADAINIATEIVELVYPRSELLGHQQD